MPFEVRYDPETACIYAKVEGALDVPLLEQFAKEYVTSAKRHDCLRILTDMTKADVKLSTMEIYEIPDLVRRLGMDIACRRAFVVAADLADYSFFENISRNRSHDVAVFQDTAEAKQWLFTDEVNA